MKSVFISRNLVDDSEFKYLLEAQNIAVVGYSLIKFKAIPFQEVPDTDWIFFYSSKAVFYFFEGIQSLSFSPNFKEVKYACMGTGTAKELAKYIPKINFIGKGKPKEVTYSFLHMAENQRVLFPQAKKSRQTVQKVAGERILSQSLLVYSNKPKIDYNMISRDLLVFTSPLNAEAYFHQYALQPHQKIVAIGDTTANALKKMGYYEIVVAGQSNERSMANAVLQLANA